MNLREVNATESREGSRHCRKGFPKADIILSFGLMPDVSQRNENLHDAIHQNIAGDWIMSPCRELGVERIDKCV